jgi:hypothetical protein
MIVRVDENTVDGAMTGGPVRLAVRLREVHETSFRALVVAGASAGEAAVAAGQVLHAELHHGNGIRGLVRDLDAGHWTQRGLDVSPVRIGGWTALRLVSAARGGPLRCAALIADLAAAASPLTVVAADWLCDVDPLMDHALLLAAAANGCAVAAVCADAGALRVRAATPDGAVGVGDAGILGRVQPPAAALSPGVVVFGHPHVDRTTGVWTSPDSLRHRRREAALAGVLVDHDLWARAYDASRAYLVPES